MNLSLKNLKAKFKPGPGEEPIDQCKTMGSPYIADKYMWGNSGSSGEEAYKEDE